MRKTLQCEKGFSLVEIITVLVVVGIIGAVILSRGPSTDIFELKSQTDIIKGHLRYAQAKSMNSDSVWGLSCDGTNYWLFRNGNTANTMILPGEDSINLNLAARKINITAFTVSYDSWGKPYNDQAATALQGGPRTISVTSTGSAPAQSIIITDNTGFVK